LLNRTYLGKYPESVSETIPSDKIYCGRYTMDMMLPGTSMSVGEAILSPTRTYLPVLKKVFDVVRRDLIHGIVHCTGGGQVKCRDFGSSLIYIKDALFERPAVFEAISSSGEITEPEMYQIFNMGHRMEIYCPENTADLVISVAKEFGIEAKIIGHTEKNISRDNKVMIRDRGNLHEY
jgi:phosphoribosylformylglycinamidine cyclo-ligase